ncbi:hypothetical protein U1839_13425 [Sphingomonas sp. RT2P30]|uniref:hypothetical protein n=1 Tax=Parasphingomonas halimpatiens TaxID=3096162 RepID=UPI002FC6D885
MVQCVRTAVAMIAALIVAAPAAAQAVQVSSWAAPAGDGMSPDEIAWHVRAGLNVAALACRDRDAATMVARYNRMLAKQRVPLAAARAGVEASLRERFGAAWQERDDDAMTRLYNHFAAPEAHDAFCAAARDLLRDGEGVAPAEFQAFARYALPQLEQAFAPQRSLVAQARYILAARDDTPRVAFATNARVPLAPLEPAPADAQPRDAAPAAVEATATAPVIDPAEAPAPGFSSTWP